MLGVKQPQGEHRETDAIDPEQTCGAPCGRLLQFVVIVALGMASSPPGDR